MSKPVLPEIKEIKLSTLVKDYALAGRSEKEIKDNAKELAPMLANGWSPSQPGEVFMRDGKPHLAAGFTRAAAAELRDHKTGFFVEIADDPAILRTVCIRTNASKPISAFEQGRKFAEMRDGTNTDDLAVGGAVLAPMTATEIAKEVGKTSQHVGNCIAVFENPPEIAELICSGSISAPVVVKAKQLVKSEPKLIKFVKAIVKHAEAEGKKSATLADLTAVRPDYAPLVAKKSATPPKPEEPAKAPDGGSEPQPPAQGQGESPASNPAPYDPVTHTPSDGDPAPQSQPDLFAQSPAPTPAKKSKIKPETIRAELLVIVNGWCEETSNSPTDEELDQLLDALGEYVAKLGSPF